MKKLNTDLQELQKNQDQQREEIEEFENSLDDAINTIVNTGKEFKEKYPIQFQAWQDKQPITI